MNEKKNLYKLDDFSIILSYLLTLIFLFQFRHLWPVIQGGDARIVWEAVKEHFLTDPFKLGMLLFAAVFFQILGRTVRKKEKISLEVIKMLGRGGRHSLSSVAFELSMSEAKASKLLNQLAAIPGAGVSFDGVNVSREVQHTPPPGMREDKFRSADRFGNPEAYQQKSRSEAPSPSKESLPPGTPPPFGEASVRQPQNQSLSSLKGFNIAIFLILFFAFWPAAFIYAARSVIKNSQAKALSDQ